MKIILLSLALLLLPGCSSFPQLLPQIVKLVGGIAESAQLLSVLDGEARAVYPAGVPAEFADALQAAKASLHALQAAQLAAESGDGPAVAGALRAFQAAFVALRMAASRLGIIRPDGTLAHTRTAGTTFGARAPYVFPTPKLLDNNAR